MSGTILYYISGHGYGHARRSAAVIRMMAQLSPAVRIQIATSAPRRILADVLSDRVTFREASLDPGAVEDDAMRINATRTAERVRAAIDRLPELVASERKLAPPDLKLIAADIPFLAGDIARALGVPCMALGNFTWDWIYEPWLEGTGRDLIGRIQASYATMAGILKLPFGGRVDMFPQVVQAPLIVNRPRIPADEVRRRLGLEGERRPIVLVGQRGGMAEPAVRRAATDCPNLVFLLPDPLADPPANVRPIELNEALSFTDVLGCCAAVISKLGYGTVSECIGADVGLLWAQREGFREDRVMAEESADILRHHCIDAGSFVQGDWKEGLGKLLSSPPPPRKASTDGDRFCAEILLGLAGVS